MTTMQAIENFLLETIGLDSESLGNNTVQRTVVQRMRVSGTQNLDEYLKKLKRDPSELQSLIDAVTVPETWFFRDKEPFLMLGNVIRRKWFPPSKVKPLRILSLPCATGEEPYSIAMVLKEMGYASDTVRIDAVDISVRALDRAERAVYGPNSFRGDEGHYQAKYFSKTGEGFVLSDAVKSMVTFRHGNLLHDFFLSGLASYDIIFCRNVLIYFSRAQQEKAIVKLHRLLVPEGLLFVGHAEGGRLLGDYFTSMKQTGTFAFQRRSGKPEPAEVVSLASSAAPQQQPKEPMHKVEVSAVSKRSVRIATSELAQKAKEELKRIGAKEKAEPSVLDEVRRLADQGSLDDAGRLCERFLVDNNISADAYYLLGLIRQAEGQDGVAGELFRKAVYLDARHYQALVHLAAQAEYTGNIAAAVVYRARASRLMEKK